MKDLITVVYLLSMPLVQLIVVLFIISLFTPEPVSKFLLGTIAVLIIVGLLAWIVSFIVGLLSLFK